MTELPNPHPVKVTLHAKTTLTPGGIYRLDDSLIKIPDSDAKKTRTLHDHRTVLVMSNALVCRSYDYACVIVAPMSHLVNYCASVDLIIKPNSVNKLNSPGRVMLSYMQPVQKSDIRNQIGVMSDEDWQAIMVALVAGIDH
jgi:hypothetical protein